MKISGDAEVLKLLYTDKYKVDLSVNRVQSIV